MKIPKSITIAGKLWKTVYVNGLKDSEGLNDGLCDYDERIIYLRKELPKKLKPSVYVHELIHAILYELHLSANDGWPGGLIEEVICDGMTTALLDNFQLKKKPHTRKGNN